MDIFRGRYRESFETPKAIAPNTPLAYRFVLPTANHVFLPGHRIMVQVQSSWFPLYDRNPQTFVPNIFFAKPEDYVKATQRVYTRRATASSSSCRWSLPLSRGPRHPRSRDEQQHQRDAGHENPEGHETEAEPARTSADVAGDLGEVGRTGAGADSAGLGAATRVGGAEDEHGLNATSPE